MQDVVFNFPLVIIISPSGLNIKRNARQTTLRSAAKPTREVLISIYFDFTSHPRYCFYSTEVMISSQSCGLRGVSRDREKVPDAELRGELHPGLHAQVHPGPAGLGEEGVSPVQREK